MKKLILNSWVFTIVLALTLLITYTIPYILCMYKLNNNLY